VERKSSSQRNTLVNDSIDALPTLNLASIAAVRFIADDKGAFTSALGLLFDASDRLGGPRSKRYVIVADNNKVTTIAVEQVPGDITVTAADKILASI